MLGVITRIRQEEVAIMADEESTFHQVEVQDEDATLLRFLWWPSDDFSLDLVEYRMAAHLFGATLKSRYASLALCKYAEDSRDQFEATMIKKVLLNFFFDYCLTPVSSD
jgi:hypothetical protein